jgi:carboxyl-terminal processing protease
VYKTTSSPIDTEIPLAVFIDGGSASSSEIVAGALQDLDRAVIIGSRSFGKGLVQSTRQLPYDGLLKVTIAKYYIPSGRLIQAIDYSHRNPDGSVARIPDSLTNVFKTAHGREVRDGGGITPDIKVTYPTANRLTYNIVRDNWAFDYATRFAATTPTIASAHDFVITDSIFNDFKKFIDPEKFQYDKVCEKMLSDLKETAKIEGYANDSINAQFEILEGMLKHNLDKDLDNNRKEISELLASEIIKRYYYQKGQIIESLKSDIALDSAAVILNDLNAYRKILSPVKK